MNLCSSFKPKVIYHLLAIALTSGFLFTGYGQEILNNSSIIELQKAGLSEGTILQKIKSSKCDFDTTVSGLKQLKAENVSDTVILAILTAPAPAAVNPPAEPKPSTNDTSVVEKKPLLPAKVPAGSSTNSHSCLANYTEEGGFWAGKTFRTFQDFSGVEKGVAFDRLAAGLASDGWHIVTVNKDVGLLSASTSVTAGEGKTAPFNVVVTDTGPGTIRVQLTFQTTIGEMASKKSVQAQFCKLLDSVEH